MGPSLSLVAVCSVVVKETTSHRWCLVASCIRLPLSAGRPDRAGFTVAIAAAASLRLWHLVKQVTGAPLKCGPSIRLMSWWFNARVHPRPTVVSPSGDCRTQAGVSSRRTRLEETRGGGGGTTWLLLLLLLRRPHTHTHTPSSPSLAFSHPYFMKRWDDGCFGERSVPSISRLGPRCLLAMISLEPGGQHAHTHARTETHTHLLSPRLRLPVCPAAQVTHSGLDGVCHKAGVWCLHKAGCASACVASLRVCARAALKPEGDLARSAPVLWTHLWLN